MVEVRPEYNSNAIPVVLMKNAWLITWMGTEPWAAPHDWRSIMAIVNGRRSDKFITDLLWILHVRACETAHGMAYWATRRRRYGLPARVGPGWRTHGSNTWLYARRVLNLRISMVGDDEQIEWQEPDYVGNHALTSDITILDKGHRRVVRRNRGENIGAEPWHRWI